MSSVLHIPASSFVFATEGSLATERAPSDEDAAAIESRLRAELQVESDQRVAEGITQQTRAIQQRYEQLLANCSSQFSTVIDSLRREIQDKVVDLSIELAEVIVRHQLPDRGMMRQLISKTLDPISDLQGACIRVCPADHELIGDQMVNDLNGIRHAVELVDDPQLQPGDIIVESQNGIFDARLDERLKLLKDTLNERCGRTTESASEA